MHLHQLMVHPVTCRYAGVVPKCPRSIYPQIALIGGGQPASLSISFRNIGPQTTETDACFQLLTTYAVPR